MALICVNFMTLPAVTGPGTWTEPSMMIEVLGEELAPLPAWDFNPPGSINGQGLNPEYGMNIYLRQAVPLVQITFMTSPQGLGGSVVTIEAFDSSGEAAGSYQTTTVGVPEVFEFTGDIQRIEIRGTRHEHRSNSSASPTRVQVQVCLSTHPPRWSFHGHKRRALNRERLLVVRQETHSTAAIATCESIRSG